MRILKFLFVMLAAGVLSGCSVTRLAYDNADSLLRWRANSYFDFEGEQSVELDRRIAAFHAWHRAKALPQYGRVLEEARARVLRGLTRADLEWGYDVFRAQANETLGAAAAEIAPLLDRLSREQIAHFEQRLADENRKFAREQILGTEQERRARRLKRNLERLEEWFGPLNDAQVERVRRYVADSPLTGELRDRDRRRRQAELLAMLRAREARARLAAWAQGWERGREPAYAAAMERLRAGYVELMLELDASLSAEQRATVADRLREYGEAFSSLAARR